MAECHWFTVNEQSFFVEEGTATWERLTESGFVPDSEHVDDVPPPPGALTRDQLVAIALDMGLTFDGRIGVPKLTALIAEAEAEADTTVTDTPEAVPNE